MLTIGNVSVQHTAGQARLCADITLNGRGTTLWFGVEEGQEEYLCPRRSDAFVMALLPAAMRGGHDIVCQTPMSQRLHYQLTEYLIPTLWGAGDLYHPMSIRAPLEDKPVENQKGVGTGFSGGVDCLYTVMTHGKDSVYPLTHLTVFNVGTFEGSAYRASFHNACQGALGFAREMGLETVFLDSNIVEVLPERFLDVSSFRLIAGALALQGLFSMYLLSSSMDFSEFCIDLHSICDFDLLTLHCANTEALCFYSAGASVKRIRKLEALADWEPAHRWVHPCFVNGLGMKNCGRCKKCVRDMISLYAMGKLDRFSPVFDIPAFQRALPQRLGMLLAKKDSRLNRESLALLEEKKIPIPAAAYECEKQFRRAMEKLKEKTE